MGRKKHHTSEQIIRKLRQAEGLLAEGKEIKEVCRALGVTDSTYYKWRTEYGSMKVDPVKRLKDLERENASLKRMAEDLSLDKQILQEFVSGKL